MNFIIQFWGKFNEIFDKHRQQVRFICRTISYVCLFFVCCFSRSARLMAFSSHVCTYKLIVCRRKSFVVTFVAPWIFYLVGFYCTLCAWSLFVLPKLVPLIQCVTNDIHWPNEKCWIEIFYYLFRVDGNGNGIERWMIVELFLFFSLLLYDVWVCVFFLRLFFFRSNQVFFILLLWRAEQFVWPDIVARDTRYLSLQIQHFDFIVCIASSCDADFFSLSIIVFHTCEILSVCFAVLIAVGGNRSVCVFISIDQSTKEAYTSRPRRIQMVNICVFFLKLHFRSIKCNVGAFLSSACIYLLIFAHNVISCQMYRFPRGDLIVACVLYTDSSLDHWCLAIATNIKELQASISFPCCMDREFFHLFIVNKMAFRSWNQIFDDSLQSIERCRAIDINWTIANMATALFHTLTREMKKTNEKTSFAVQYIGYGFVAFHPYQWNLSLMSVSINLNLCFFFLPALIISYHYNEFERHRRLCYLLKLCVMIRWKWTRISKCDTLSVCVFFLFCFLIDDTENGAWWPRINFAVLNGNNNQ